VSVEVAVQRAMGYALLARCFAYPDDLAVEGIRATAAASEAVLEGTVLGPLATAAARVAREELEERYAGLFTLSSSPDCPTFETAFLSTDPIQQTNRMADIAGFYRAFGVDTGGNGCRPDDISVELEFMGFLCRKEAYAAEHLGAPRVAQTLRAERLFLREHLGRWAGAAGSRLALQGADAPFYAMLGKALDVWVSQECERMQTGPVDTVDGPRMDLNKPEPEADSVIDFDDIPVA